MSAERVTQLIEAGLWLRMSGDVEGARRLFEQALKLDPGNAQAKQLLTAPARGPSAPVPPSELPRELKQTPPPRQSSFEPQGERERERPPPPLPTVPPVSPRGPLAPPQSVYRPPTPVPAVPPVPAFPSIPPRVAPLTAPQFPPPPPPDASWPQPLSSPTTPFGYGEAPPAPPTAWETSGGQPGFNLTPSPDHGRDAVELLKDENLPVPFRTPPPATQPRRAEGAKTLLTQAAEQMKLDNHTGALELIMKAQMLEPENPDVAVLKARSEETLQAMYESKLGNLNVKPRVRMKDDEVIWLNLDHRAGFVLAQIDGTVSFEDLFLVCGMTRLDTARILVQLKDEGVIG